jgi:hypothetical protein
MERVRVEVHISESRSELSYVSVRRPGGDWHTYARRDARTYRLVPALEAILGSKLFVPRSGSTPLCKISTADARLLVSLATGMDTRWTAGSSRITNLEVDDEIDSEDFSRWQQ